MFVNIVAVLFILVGALLFASSVEIGLVIMVRYVEVAIGTLWVAIGMGLWRRKELARLAGLALLLQFMWWMVLVPIALVLSGVIFLVVGFLDDLLNSFYAAAMVLVLIWGLPFFGSLWSYRRFQSDAIVSEFIAGQPANNSARMKVYFTAVVFFVLPLFLNRQFVIP